MQYKPGMIVYSKMGHDKNRFYVLTEVDNAYGYIADGKRRKLEKPKRKNLIHLSSTTKLLPHEEWNTNLKLRRVLFSYNYDKAASVAE